MKIELDGQNIDFHPTKIVCLAKNYAAHAKEMSSTVPKRPSIFLKPLTTLLPDGGSIIIPPASKQVEHEVELAVIIGKRCCKISEADAMNYVLGYSIMLDITARDLQHAAKEAGMPWTEAKGFDTFAPFGPVIIPAGKFDPADAVINLKVNGVLKQSGNISDMVFKVPRLISHISHIMTLEEHDIIATGTPDGVGRINAGDKLEAEIEEIGVLKNVVS